MASKKLDDIIALMHPRAKSLNNAVILRAFNYRLLPEIKRIIQSYFRDYYLQTQEIDISYPIGETGSITAMATAGGGSKTTFTSAGHGMAVGQYVIITGTDAYDGTYEILAVATDTFTLRVDFDTDEATGTWQLKSGYGIITAAADGGGGEVTITSADHGLTTGMEVTISGTTDYNGTYIVNDYTDDTFNITETYTSSQTGNWQFSFGYELDSTFGTLVGIKDQNGSDVYIGYNLPTDTDKSKVQIYSGNIYVDDESNFQKLYVTYTLAMDVLAASTAYLPFPEYIQDELLSYIILGMDYFTFREYRKWHDAEESFPAFEDAYNNFINNQPYQII